MTQPVWITPAGNLGVIPVGTFFQLTLLGELPGEPNAEIYYTLIAGKLPDGIQCASNGTISGTPDAVASLQGVPLEVGRNTTSKFTVRIYPENDPTNIRDRTFTITIAVIPEPVWVTPAGLVASYYDSDPVYFLFEFDEVYTPDTTVVTLVAGALPGGLTLGLDGLLTGYVQPAQNIDAVAGYDISAQDADPYDFLSQSISKNYQFTLQVSNGHASSLRTFEIFVYSRSQMQASDNTLIDNNTFVTTDETPYQAPFLTNATPSNLGTIRSSNYFAYQFIGENYINQPITYAISVNQGAGFAPGLTLDPTSGWYYGYVPDQGTTETEYSFNIVVYQNEYITPKISITQTATTGYITASYITNQLEQGMTLVLDSNFGGLVAGTVYYVENIISETANWNTTLDQIISYNTVFTVRLADSSLPTLTNTIGLVEATRAIECTATTTGTNLITCSTTVNLGVGQPLIFTGTAFGGITAAAQTIYYVSEISSENTFKVSTRPLSSTSVTLTTAAGSMFANMILASSAYPFSITVTGAVDAEVTWDTPEDLGDIINGSVSRLSVSATNRGGRTMKYRLKSGAYNSLPQGLQLMTSGDIVGRVSFDTFALDLGTTTFDQSFAINRNLTSLGTTFDQTYIFTVNAYAEDTNQTIYEVASIQVNNGGSGYSEVNKPTIAISSPVGASAVTAVAGTVTVSGSAITEVLLSENGNGYVQDTITAGNFVVGAPYDITTLGTTNFVTIGATSVTGTFSIGKTYIITSVGTSDFTLIGATSNTVGVRFTAIGPPNDSTVILAGTGAAIGTLFTSIGVGTGTGTAKTLPAVRVTQGFGGNNATLYAILSATGSKDVISVFKTFQVHVIREYDRPYQNLYVRAMPPPNDRALIRSLLDDEEIFPPEYLYRSDDPNFGKSTQVTYSHAFGLAPDTLERYVSSLYENHYWKNLILGEIDTAQAIDPVTGEVVYEIVYSKIIDNLVNTAGESVNKIVTLPYAIVDPADGSTLITSVYPNSLVNMRNQVIDVVGQISNILPLWMTSKQPNGRVLGFTPAWVIAYVNPGRAKEVAYFIQTYFAQQLNSVDFKVDRYILDRVLSKNWDVDTQHWVPRPPTLTTFDRFSTGDKIFVGTVDICTRLAWSDVNDRSLTYINELGGLDGIIDLVEGKTIIFAKQEDYNGPPGSNYATTNDAWQTWQAASGGVSGIPETYYDAYSLDYSTTVPGNDLSTLNERMAIYTININSLSGCLELTLTTQTQIDDYVQILEGEFYRSAYLYYPSTPGEGLTEISWLPLVTIGVTPPLQIGTRYQILSVGNTNWTSVGASANQVGVIFTATGVGSGNGTAKSIETIFDGNSLKFIAPVDMYDPTDTYDKYLVFPKSNILV
jgi:hypothetical protein